MILPGADTLNADTEAPMDREVRDFKVRRQLASLRDQAEREIAGARAARYAAHREEAGAYLTQPFTAVEADCGQMPGPAGYQPGVRTISVDLAPRPPADLSRLTRIEARKPRIAPLPPARPSVPLRAPLGAISAAIVGQIGYPDPAELSCGLMPGAYAPALRHVGAATGTRTELEDDAAWRLALEAGSEAGA